MQTTQELKDWLTNNGLKLKLRPEPRVRENIHEAVALYCALNTRKL